MCFRLIEVTCKLSRERARSYLVAFSIGTGPICGEGGRQASYSGTLNGQVHKADAQRASDGISIRAGDHRKPYSPKVSPFWRRQCDSSREQGILPSGVWSYRLQ